MDPLLQTNYWPGLQTRALPERPPTSEDSVADKLLPEYDVQGAIDEIKSNAIESQILAQLPENQPAPPKSIWERMMGSDPEAKEAEAAGRKYTRLVEQGGMVPGTITDDWLKAMQLENAGNNKNTRASVMDRNSILARIKHAEQNLFRTGDINGFNAAIANMKSEWESKWTDEAFPFVSTDTATMSARKQLSKPIGELESLVSQYNQIGDPSFSQNKVNEVGNNIIRKAAGDSASAADAEVLSRYVRMMTPKDKEKTLKTLSDINASLLALGHQSAKAPVKQFANQSNEQIKRLFRAFKTGDADTGGQALGQIFNLYNDTNNALEMDGLGHALDAVKMQYDALARDVRVSGNLDRAEVQGLLEYDIKNRYDNIMGQAKALNAAHLIEPLNLQPISHTTTPPGLSGMVMGGTISPSGWNHEPPPPPKQEDPPPPIQAPPGQMLGAPGSGLTVSKFGGKK